MPRARLRARIAVAAAALLALAAAPVAHADVTLDIVDLPRPVLAWGYDPETVRVMPGEWVIWSNAGQEDHSVTSLDGTSFDSGLLRPSEGFALYFESPGTHDYFCTLHEWMKGRVVVGPVVVEGPPPFPGLGDHPVVHPGRMPGEMMDDGSGGEAAPDS